MALFIIIDWFNLGSSNKLWKLFYHYRFIRFNPNTDLPSTYTGNYKISFEERLQDPCIGDKVEVAWKGTVYSN